MARGPGARLTGSWWDPETMSVEVQVGSAPGGSCVFQGLKGPLGHCSCHNFLSIFQSNSAPN